MIYGSSWEDLRYSADTSGSPLTYYIQKGMSDDREVIYTGKAYPRPNSTVVDIPVNDIFSNYLDNDVFKYWDFVSFETMSVPNGVMQFEITDGENVLETYRIKYDWSYEESWNGESGTTLSYPINGRINRNAYCFSSSLGSGTFNTSITVASASTQGLYELSDVGCVALYYEQRNGAYASFMVEGNTGLTDSYDRLQIRTSETDRIRQGKTTYQNTITEGAILYTGWLSDEESENFCFNLLPSKTVYMHNLCTGEICPVLITNTEAQYKTFKNNNRHLVSYQITVEKSHQKYIR